MAEFGVGGFSGGTTAKATDPRPLPPDLKQSERLFPSQNPALRGFPVAEFGAGGCSSGKKSCRPRRHVQGGDKSRAAISSRCPVCSQGLYALRGFVCPQGTCMPSRDLYALKGFVCPQGTCMPSRDLGPLGRAHVGPGSKWAPGRLPSPLKAYKSLEGIQIL